MLVYQRVRGSVKGEEFNLSCGSQIVDHNFLIRRYQEPPTCSPQAMVELSPSAETVGINSSAGLAHDDYGTPGSMGNMTWHDIAIVGCIAHLKEQNNLYCWVWIQFQARVTTHELVFFVQFDRCFAIQFLGVPMSLQCFVRLKCIAMGKINECGATRPCQSFCGLQCKKTSGPQTWKKRP